MSEDYYLEDEGFKKKVYLKAILILVFFVFLVWVIDILSTDKETTIVRSLIIGFIMGCFVSDRVTRRDCKLKTEHQYYQHLDRHQDNRLSRLNCPFCRMDNEFKEDVELDTELSKIYERKN